MDKRDYRDLDSMSSVTVFHAYDIGDVTILGTFTLIGLNVHCLPFCPTKFAPLRGVSLIITREGLLISGKVSVGNL